MTISIIIEIDAIGDRVSTEARGEFANPTHEEELMAQILVGAFEAILEDVELGEGNRPPFIVLDRGELIKKGQAGLDEGRAQNQDKFWKGD